MVRSRCVVLPTEPHPAPQEALDAFMRHLHECTGPCLLNRFARIFDRASLVDAEVRGGAIWLKEIRVWEYRNGHGTRALQFICNLADTYGVVVRLTPVRIGKQGMMVRDLRKWYRAFDFKPSGDIMRREPQRPVTKLL